MNKEAKNNRSFMEKLATFIVDRRNFIIFFFLIAAIFCAFSRNWVKVNDDITVYLSEDTETRQGLDIMNSQFTTYATAEVMVDSVSYEQAEEILGRIEEIEGVKSVDFDDSEDHYKESAALFNITFDGDTMDEVPIAALAETEELLAPYDSYVKSEIGNPLEKIIESEMLIVDLIAFVIIILVLLFTSKSYAEVPVLLLTFGAAAILNMGTNFIFGTISFVSNSIAIVLQLALAVDYAIILCHRFTEEKENLGDARQAAIISLSKAIPEISASSLTTVAGLLAMTFMSFRLGYDMGIVLIKAIILSLLSVFLLMPGLLLIFSKWMDKTKHRNFVPKISFLGKTAYATRYVVPVLFIAILIGAYVCSNRVNYVYSVYSVTSFRQNESQLAKKKIEETFGKTNQLAVIVPAGDYESEKKLTEDLEQLQGVESVLGLANIEVNGAILTDGMTPRQFSEYTDLDYEVAATLYAAYAADKGYYGQVITNISNYSVPLIDMASYLVEEQESLGIVLDRDTSERIEELRTQLDDAKAQLMSDEYSRIVVELNLPTEGESTFGYLSIIHGLEAKYYSEYYAVGDSTSCYDLMKSFEKDNVLNSILTILFVIAVLLLTFKSVGLPVLLILVIQGSIWCNFAIPYLRNSNVFFLSFLIVSSIQMGANIDYAIVISSRYMEYKSRMPVKEAMIETLNMAFPTIITSGLMLASAGIAIGLVTSDETISKIGAFIGSGTLISIFLVMCILPQILLLGDTLISRTSFTITNPIQPTVKTGIVQVNGRVRGMVNGIIDAEIKGVFSGEINAIMDMGTVNDIPEDRLNELGELKKTIEGSGAPAIPETGTEEKGGEEQ